MHAISRTILTLAAGVSIPGVAAGQSARGSAPVVYEIAFPNAVHHEAQVKVSFANVPNGPLELRMSRSSPGRYALHEFAKNVYGVRALDSKGRELMVSRPNPHQWNVSGHDGTVVVTYTLFGDRADGTYAAIDLTHAHLNMPATFMWARGMQSRPITVVFRPLRADWKVATQLAPTRDPFTFTAPGLQYFMDSPTEVSAHDVRSWAMQSGGRTQTIRFALHHEGTAAQLDSFVVNVKKVVAEQEAMWGELPRYDNGTYTFIADYLPYASGDGMEHRNSTILTSTRPLSTGAAGNLGTVSHEFFHSWNVERIRPKSLEPFDFEEANMSGELWLAEGFTSYYDDLFIRRAGLMDVAGYAQSLTGNVNAVVNAPGRRFFSPVGMSQQAPFVDAAASIDPQNKTNTFISYYTYGAALGLALDLEIRSKFPGRSLDDFMRRMWIKYGKTERAYTLDDVRRTLGEAVGNPAYGDDVFRRYIMGSDLPRYESLLAAAGMSLRRAKPGAAWIGDLGLRVQDTGIVVGASVLLGTPAYVAGIAQGDRIVSIGGRTITAAGDVDTAVAATRPGGRLAIVIAGRGGRREIQVAATENPRMEIVPYEVAGLRVTAQMKRFRNAWMGSRTELRRK
ncbi:MAG: PDZ domain-containing protein [Gemmatimonadaceae bacterium]